jgi:predicted nucleic acid-binding Zn ribbon protein
MPIYRYYCLDAGDRVTATGLVDCETDDDVRARARRLLDISDHASIEIRYGGKHVQRVDKSRSSTRRGTAS